ncbi:hypothetical protein, partial [Pseudomonas aeruginosa]|uniref:hypothetical protein n=1 Tax=Pseudomonas aeruginosa TaxID=287 RepID=UPI001C608CBE
LARLEGPCEMTLPAEFVAIGDLGDIPASALGRCEHLAVLLQAPLLQLAPVRAAFLGEQPRQVPAGDASGGGHTIEAQGRIIEEMLDELRGRQKR